ncbi:hypothetical protein CSA37_05860 [Candidatus Fermentibacteria bacterium]|nr:MAG: hypothetical protein CSA37_05860 [Candidatus Fermentibacteria bacterium]
MNAILILAAIASAAYSSASFEEAVTNVADMVWNSKITGIASDLGLDIVNVTWEDTGRYDNSCWGPNISDLTIQVHHGRRNNEMLTCMPVIRYPNFHDLSADLDPDEFFLLTGNESGDELEPVSLTEYVDNLRSYLHDEDSWGGRGESLLAERDSVVLVSAQAVFLPVEDDGEAIFNPVLYNYQSYEENPGVLAILATREGTSATIIDNSQEYSADYYSGGQRLYFNDNGERASLTGSRLSDFISDSDNLSELTGEHMEAAGEEGLNMVLLIQIPLKQKERRDLWFEEDCYGMGELEYCCEESASPVSSDVEAAVIGHGELEGPFREIDGLPVVRDDRFPVRVTVQFYKATSNGVATEADIAEIAAQITRVYDDASYVGSLVCPEEKRPTDWDRDAVEVYLKKFFPF